MNKVGNRYKLTAFETHPLATWSCEMKYFDCKNKIQRCNMEYLIMMSVSVNELQCSFPINVIKSLGIYHNHQVILWIRKISQLGNTKFSTERSLKVSISYYEVSSAGSESTRTFSSSGSNWKIRLSISRFVTSSVLNSISSI